MSKPFVYVASPYTKGDVAINTRFQMEIFDQLMDDGIVIPYVPLWTHFQHLVFPRPYRDWIDYDLYMINRRNFNACLRLDARYDVLGYVETKSSGADGEVVAFEKLNLPVFKKIDDLYDWVKNG